MDTQEATWLMLQGGDLSWGLSGRPVTSIHPFLPS